MCEHSLNVYDMLSTQRSPFVKANEESIAIIALFHDLCKCSFYKTAYRKVEEPKGVWNRVPYYAVDEKFAFGHSEKSFFIINNFMRLTTEEAVSINAHMGGFDDRAKGGSYAIGNMFNQCPLAVETSIADLRATYLVESKGE